MRFAQVLILFCSIQVFAFDLSQNFKGFVQTGSKELYVDYLAPQKNRPTVILLNGLTYSTVQWDQLTEQLKSKGLGIFRYDMDGMGQTLLKSGYPDAPFPYQDQVTDLNKLLKKLNLKLPYNIIGLSYGGGIGAVFAAQYPKKIANLILMAPYTQALEQQDTWIKKQIALTRLQFPMNPYSDDALYDYFLKQICYSTYPLVEPIVLENPYKLEAVFRMTQGIRRLNLATVVKQFPDNAVSLLIARNDQYIPQPVLENFWASIPEAARVQKIYVENSEHKIPEAQPAKAADLIEQIVNRTK